jgi:hypothetical protein
MIESYLVLAGRIRQELDEIERLIARASRAFAASLKNPHDSDLYMDSAALNLHDSYSGLERVFKQIAATVDGSLPSAPDWHRQLLQQMELDLPKVRPPVLSVQTIEQLDEYLRFRHVVRNVYTFSFDPERVGRLVAKMEDFYPKLRAELLAFADFLESVGAE